MANNQPGDNLNPKIQQELLNNLRVDGDLTLGNINQQNVTQIFLIGLPHQQELIINWMRQHFQEDSAIAGVGYTPEIQEVLSPSSTASWDAEVIPPSPSSPTISTFEFEVVKVDADGKAINRSCKQAQYFIESLGDAVVLEMVCIESGKFLMGAPKEELESDEDERPQNLVTVKPFWMSKYPITQAQWIAIASLRKIKRDLKPDRFIIGTANNR